MDKEQAVEQILGILEEQRSAFLDDLQYAVQEQIQNQGADCLTIVERNPDGSVHATWQLQASIDYLERLNAFTAQQEEYNGYKLDSVLSDPVIEVVVKRFEHFYKMNSTQMARVMLRDYGIATSLIENVLERNAEIDMTARAREKAARVVVEELHEQLSTQSGEIVSTTASAATNQQIADLVLGLLTLQMQAVILKVIAFPLINQVLILIVQRFVARTIIAAIVRFVAVRIGVGVGGATMIFLLPIMAAWIAHDILNFPRELGRNIAIEVRKSLEKHFETINREVVEAIYDEFSTTGVQQLSQEIAGNDEMKTYISVLIEDDEEEDVPAVIETVVKEKAPEPPVERHHIAIEIEEDPEDDAKMDDVKIDDDDDKPIV